MACTTGRSRSRVIVKYGAERREGSAASVCELGRNMAWRLAEALQRRVFRAAFHVWTTRVDRFHRWSVSGRPRGTAGVRSIQASIIGK